MMAWGEYTARYDFDNIKRHEDKKTIREDLKKGVSFRQAVDSGFAGATTVILDSNITTFLGGLILFKFGGPAVKGFAVTLMAGILATLIAGIFFLRSLITWVTDLRGGKTIKF